MVRLFGPGLVGIVLFGLWLYAILDVISTEESLVRNLPKVVWLVLVVFVPTVGAVAWLLLGRPAYAGWRPGDTTIRRPPVARGLEDDPMWNAGAREDRLRTWQRDLERREAELRKERGEPGDGDDPKPFPHTW